MIRYSYKEYLKKRFLMEIRVLKYFLATAKEGNITNAANSLHLTQPTLSKQLKELEYELGQKLFKRGQHGITLTPEGMILRKRAEEIIEMVEKTKNEVSSAEDTISGDIFLGCGETDSMRLIAHIFHNIHLEFPKIKYHVNSGNADDILERLDKGLLDFGLLIEPIDLSKYEYIKLPTYDVWGVIMRKDDKLAQKKSLKLNDILKLPLLGSRQLVKHKAASEEFLKWFNWDLEKLNLVGTYNLIYNAGIMVEEGLGYALTLDKLINATSNSRLCFKPLSPKLKSALYIVWKKSQIFSPAAKLFLERIYYLNQT